MWLLTSFNITLAPQSIVGALYYGAGLGGRAGNWVDGTAGYGTGVNHPDQDHHLAKVRVVGSNPLFRSIVPGQDQFFRSSDFSGEMTRWQRWQRWYSVKRIRSGSHR